MSGFTEELNLDLKNVKNHADVYSGYANYLINLENEKYRPYIASSLLISAMFSSILNPKKSIGEFRKSARYYKLENNSFWKIVAVCGFDIQLINESKENIKPENSYSPNQSFANMLSKQFIQTSNGQIDFSYSESSFISQPIGRLGIPMNSFINAYIELAELSHNTKQIRRLVAWNTLLNRAAERTRILQSDSYHWKKLKGTFIPVEPEILGTCINFCQFIRKREINFNLLMENFHLDRIARIPLMIAKEIVINNDY